MKLIASIGPTEVRELEAEGDDYDSARAAVEAQVPEGWRILSFRAIR